MPGRVVLGSHRVRRVGYGAAFRIAGRPATRETLERPDALRRLLREAVDLGVNFVDTADSYGPGLSEELVAEALRPVFDEVLIATKGGVVRTGFAETRLDAHPDQLRAACEASLRRLRCQAIGLYQLHWPDPEIPFEEQVGALADLVAAGKVRLVGLCNVTPEQVEAAHRIMPIASVQARLGVSDGEHAALADRCAELDVAFIAYSPLNVLRRGTPELRERLAGVARRHGATPSQVALAWILNRSANTIAIPGTVDPRHLRENAAAESLVLSPEDMAALS